MRGDAMAKKRSKKKSKNPTHVTNREDLARIFGRSVECFDHYRRDGCPCGVKDKIPNKGYSVAKVRAWLRKNGLEQPRRPGRPVSLDDSIKPGDGGEAQSTHTRIRMAQAEQNEAKAEMARLALAERRGELLSMEDIRQRHTYMREQLKGMARSAAPELAGKTALEVMQILEARIDSVLEVFSDG